jgi:hypothetical protein
LPVEGVDSREARHHPALTPINFDILSSDPMRNITAKASVEECVCAFSVETSLKQRDAAECLPDEIHGAT